MTLEIVHERLPGAGPVDGAGMVEIQPRPPGWRQVRTVAIKVVQAKAGCPAREGSLEL